MLHIDDETSEMKRRETSSGRARTRAATERPLEQEESAELSAFAFDAARKISIDLGKLLTYASTLPFGVDGELS